MPKVVRDARALGAGGRDAARDQARARARGRRLRRGGRVHGPARARRDELFDEDARRDQRLIAVTAGAALAQTRTLEDAIRLAKRVDASRRT